MLATSSNGGRMDRHARGSHLTGSNVEHYTVRRKILSLLETHTSLAELADVIGTSDARLLWHLRQMREDAQVESSDEMRWVRTEKGLQVLMAPQPEAAGRAFPNRIVDDFEDAIVETATGLFGTAIIQASGEHRGRLSVTQAAEFRDRLVSLIEEYFAPGQGDQTGIKHGFHWVLTPIDLHPLDDEG
jgi:hypothetical protein